MEMPRGTESSEVPANAVGVPVQFGRHQVLEATDESPMTRRITIVRDRTRKRDAEIILSLTADEYRKAGEQIRCLLEAGSISTTGAILDALRMASAMLSADTDEAGSQ